MATIGEMISTNTTPVVGSVGCVYNRTTDEVIVVYRSTDDAGTEPTGSHTLNGLPDLSRVSRLAT